MKIYECMFCQSNMALYDPIAPEYIFIRCHSVSCDDFTIWQRKDVKVPLIFRDVDPPPDGA